MVENFPEFTKHINSKIWESHKILSKKNKKKFTFRYIVLK